MATHKKVAIDFFSEKELKVLSKAKRWAEKFFKDSEKKGVISGGHGFDHSKRVAGMAALLAIKENKEPFLPVLTALIFDVGRTSLDPRAKDYRHGEVSKELAEEFINSIKIISDSDKQLVKDAIEDHPRKNEFVRKNYITEIIMDADRLDTLGPLGVVRCAAHRWKLPLFDDDINQKTADHEITTIYQDFTFRSPEFYDMLWTKSARVLAKKWLIFLKKFSIEYRKQAEFMHRSFSDLGID